MLEFSDAFAEGQLIAGRIADIRICCGLGALLLLVRHQPSLVGAKGLPRCLIRGGLLMPGASGSDLSPRMTRGRDVSNRSPEERNRRTARQRTGKLSA